MTQRYRSLLSRYMYNIHIYIVDADNYIYAKKLHNQQQLLLPLTQLPLLLPPPPVIVLLRTTLRVLMLIWYFIETASPRVYVTRYRLQHAGTQRPAVYQLAEGQTRVHLYYLFKQRFAYAQLTGMQH